MADRAALIRTASVTALIGNFFLATVKIITGLKADSLAVLGDGLDSSMDILISLMTLLVARIIIRPADRTHPWGHGRAETVATAILSMVLFFAGAQLVLNSARTLFRLFLLHEAVHVDVPGRAAMIVTVVSILGKMLLAWSQHLFGVKADSAMLRANAKNMAADVVTSGGVLVGLAFALFLGIGWIDLVTAILVGLWVIKNSIGIFTDVNAELMDGATGDASYKALFGAVRSVPEAGNPHRVRMRRVAGFWDIDLDIEVDPSLTVREAHAVASKVEDAIKLCIDGVFDIMVHVEPAGYVSHGEVYGLSEKDV